MRDRLSLHLRGRHLNPRTVLQVCFPLADFEAYFSFLAEHQTVKGPNTQDHHILPRNPFPEFEDCPENLITLTKQDHATAHKILRRCEPSFRRKPSCTFRIDEYEAHRRHSSRS
jgi:hypothetical protein